MNGELLVGLAYFSTSAALRGSHTYGPDLKEIGVETRSRDSDGEWTLLLIACFPLSTADCQLRAAYCLLSPACCLFPIPCSLFPN
jgi:hypothetical protein